MSDHGAHGEEQPLLPPPPPPPLPSGPPATRRRWPVVVGAVAGVAAFVGIVVVSAIVIGGGDEDSGPRLVERSERESAASTEAETRSSESAAPEREEHAVGDRVETPAGNSLQVFSYEQPVPPPDEIFTPEPGHEFAVIDVEGCAGPSDDPTGMRTLNPFDFALHMPDNTRLMAHIPVAEPSLNHTELPFAGDCVRGFVTFQVPAGKKPVFIEHLHSRPRVRWNVP